MRQIIYYVATSIDGYIAGRGEDINDFQHTGNGVDQYLADLKNYDTVIMGRKTYEFGYQFGMKPGDAPYPHMQHYIFSDQLKLEHAAEQVKVYPRNIELIQELKSTKGTDTYLQSALSGRGRGGSLGRKGARNKGERAVSRVAFGTTDFPLN
ncbi:MAG: dihydrofolate reductase family protein [Lewinella sp.]